MKVDFSAAHRIVGYVGDCARLHGHNWVVEVFVSAQQLNSIGIAVDFRDVKSQIRRIIQDWDHQNLNEVAAFAEVNPTAENVAKIVFEILQKHYQNTPFAVRRVRVWENDRCAVTYFAGDFHEAIASKPTRTG